MARNFIYLKTLNSRINVTKIKSLYSTYLDSDKAKDGLIEETKMPGTTNMIAMETAVQDNDTQKDIAPDVMVETSRKALFRYSDPILNKWDTFIIIIAIYNCFTLSFNIGFDPSFASHPVYITFDVILIF